MKPDRVVVQYFSTTAQQWAPADKIAGFIRDGYETLQIDGVDWLGFDINHGGIVTVTPEASWFQAFFDMLVRDGLSALFSDTLGMSFSIALLVLLLLSILGTLGAV
jgi:hypothetical protein